MESLYSASFNPENEKSTMDALKSNSQIFSEQRRVRSILEEVINTEADVVIQPVVIQPANKALRTASTEVIEECTPIHQVETRPNSYHTVEPIDNIRLTDPQERPDTGAIKNRQKFGNWQDSDSLQLSHQHEAKITQLEAKVAQLESLLMKALTQPKPELPVSMVKSKSLIDKDPIPLPDFGSAPDLSLSQLSEIELMKLKHAEEMKECNDRLKSYEIALNRANKSIRDIELKLGIKQIGISSIARSQQMIAMKPLKPLAGKVSIPDLMAMNKKNPAAVKQLVVTDIDYQKINVGIRNLRVTLSDGQTCKGGSEPTSKTRKLPANIKKVEVIFQQSEAFIFQIRFYGRDGSKFKIGGNDYWNAGRMETFELANDEVLLGAELDYTEKYTVGVTWIKWSPQ